MVETTFGVGVVIGSTDGSSSGSHEPSSASSTVVQVQLWRLPGRSLGTGTTAYLQPSAVRVIVCLVVALLYSSYYCGYVAS